MAFGISNGKFSQSLDPIQKYSIPIEQFRGIALFTAVSAMVTALEITLATPTGVVAATVAALST